MREIKFRAKTKKDGKMVYGYYSPVVLPIFGCQGHFINEGGYQAVEIDPETVGQYSGLKDKNDVEIYEGDIVCSKYGDKIIDIGDVQFDCGVFGVEWICAKKNRNMVGAWGQRHNLRKLDDDIINEIKVIGNIHDNPELLEVEE